jgi:hypothetical protein
MLPVKPIFVDRLDLWFLIVVAAPPPATLLDTLILASKEAGIHKRISAV